MSIAADNVSLAIGARGESSSAKGISGDQNDSLSPGSGAVYVY